MMIDGIVKSKSYFDMWRDLGITLIGDGGKPCQGADI